MQADYELHKKSRKTLKNMGDLKAAVLCPDKEHLDEWLAVHSTSPLLSFPPFPNSNIYFVREQDHISILNLPSNYFSFVSCSGGFLQSCEHFVRKHWRILHSPDLPHHDRWTQVRHHLERLRHECNLG
jgi:hypothetical protein